MVIKQDKVPFEDALRMAGFGKFNLFAFGVCSSVIMGMSFEMFSVSYLVPGSSCELGTTSAQQGLIAAVPVIGVILTSHVWGYLADLKGRRRILVISMSMAFIASCLACLSPNWIVLCLLKLCSSAGVSGANAVGITLMSEYTLAERRSILVLLTTSVFLMSSGIMAVLSIPILSLQFSYYIPYLDIHFNAWRLLCVIYALPCAMGALGVYSSYESPKYLLSIGKTDEALKVLRGIFKKNSGKSGDLYRVNSIVLDEESKEKAVGFWASIKAQTLPMLKKPLLKDTILLSLFMFIVYVCINPFQIWMPFIVNAAISAVDKGSVDLTLCQMIRMSRISNSTTEEVPTDCSMNHFAMTLVFYMSFIIAALNAVVSGITQYIGRKTLFIGFQLIGGLAAIYINFSYNWIVSAICFMIYLTGVINFSSITSYTIDVYPTYVKAMAVCVILMIGRGSSIIGINVVKGLLEDKCESGFFIFGAIFLAGGFLGFLLPTDKQILQRKEDLKLKMSQTT